MSAVSARGLPTYLEHLEDRVEWQEKQIQRLEKRLNAAKVLIENLMRSQADYALEGPREPLALGRLRLNYELRRLELDGRTVPLPKQGVVLLSYLMSNPDRVIQTPILADVLSLPRNGNAVRTLIYRLKPKLVELGAREYLRSYGRSWTGGGCWMSADHEEGGAS